MVLVLRSVCCVCLHDNSNELTFDPDFYFPPGSGCEVLWWVRLCLCLCVCLSVREDISGTTCAIFANFCACCLWPWLGPSSAGWRNPKGRGSFEGFLPHWQCIVLTLLLTLCGLTSQETHREGLGLGRLVHEEAHPCFPYFTQTSLKGNDAGSINCPLLQLIPAINYSIRQKYLQQSHVLRNLASFQECPLVPLMLSSKVKSSFSLSLDSPLHILKTWILSCLFFLSTSVHNFKQRNISSDAFLSMLLIIFVTSSEPCRSAPCPLYSVDSKH